MVESGKHIRRQRLLLPLACGVSKIKIRSVSWVDLPTLFRYRKQVLSLDSCLTLTRGSPLGPFNTLSYFNPRTRIYTGICPGGKGRLPLVGQIRYALDARSARLTFLMPVNSLNSITLPGLLEHLSTSAGCWGAFHFLAEVVENDTAFEGLRRAGFSVYSWQRVWRFSHPLVLPDRPASKPSWRSARQMDGVGIRGLYQSLVPALVQPIEDLALKPAHGWVYRPKDEVLAYADLVYGSYGIWVQPFIHPSIEDVPALITNLLCSLPARAGRPIYVSVRAYQGWMESILDELKGQAAPRQALMAKHLAIKQRVTMAMRLPNLENGRTEPTAPIAHINQKHIRRME